LGPQQLLVSDLDGTLLGDAGAADRFMAWFAAHRDRWRLAFATGRSLDSVMGLVRAGEMVAPDAIISNVGTEIHDADGRPWVDWPPPHRGWDVQRVGHVLARIEGIEPQAPAAQTSIKASYHALDLSEATLADIRARLGEAGIPATLVYSSARDLDVLPAWGGKARATRFLADALGFEGAQVVVSGDSGNDLDMLTAGWPAIVVANAGPELADLRGERIYRARSGFADGVLEGIEHWETVLVEGAAASARS
jgi:sucrose-6F-phosphate phosphohydrolase